MNEMTEMAKLRSVYSLFDVHATVDRKIQRAMVLASTSKEKNEKYNI